MRKIILCCWAAIAMSCTAYSQTKAQQLIKEVKKKGTLTVEIYVETAEKDIDGKIVRKRIEETNYTTERDLVLHPGKYKLLKSSAEQLQAYADGNASFVLNDEQELGKERQPTPIKYHRTHKEWAICDGENLRLVYDELSSGTLQEHFTNIAVRMYPGDSKEKILDDEMLTRAMDELERQWLAKKREEAIKAGKTIDEKDYFVPASLPSAMPFHFYIFTWSWPGAMLKDFGVTGKRRSYDCGLNQWMDPETIKPRLSYTPETRPEKGPYRRYRTLGQQALDDLMADPKASATLIGGSTNYHSSESGYTKELQVYALQVE